MISGVNVGEIFYHAEIRYFPDLDYVKKFGTSA